jgi:hypothetical protein
MKVPHEIVEAIGENGGTPKEVSDDCHSSTTPS